MSKKVKLQTKFHYKFYKATETGRLTTKYGEVIVPKNDIIFAPENLQIKKKLYSTIENEFKQLTAKSNLNNSSLLIIRYGGIGDIIATLFGIYELKKRTKNLQIGYIASPSYSSVLTLFPLVEKIYAPVSNIHDLKKYKYICVLDDVLEMDKEATTQPMQDIYAKHMGVDKLNTGLLSPDKRKRQHIGIQYKCDVPLRNYNINQTIETINLLLEQYPDDNIYLLDKPDDFQTINYIHSKVKQNKRLIANGCGFKKQTLLELTYIIQNLKIVIGPDSGFLHIAGISKTPIVGLFGPFPSKLRLSHYLNAIGIDAHANCAPCFRHFPVSFCKFGCSESKCLSTIKPQQIINAVDELIGQ